MGAKNSTDVSPNVIVCKEQQRTCHSQIFRYFCHTCPRFDSTIAKNNLALTGILGVGGLRGTQEVERKFSEANQKVKRGYLNPSWWAVPMVVFFIAAISLLVATVVTHDKDHVICLTNNVCKWPDRSPGFGCPERSETDSWTVGCCYAFCDDGNDRYRQITGYNGICVADRSNDDNIRGNISFDTKCNCRHLQSTYFCKKEQVFLQKRSKSHCTRSTYYCGKLKIYGEYRDIPGAEHITMPIGFTFVILAIGVGVLGWFYTMWRNNQVKLILQDHFKEWNGKGIEVVYHPPWKGADGHIKIILPPSALASSAPFPTENYFSMGYTRNGQDISY